MPFLVIELPRLSNQQKLDKINIFGILIHYATFISYVYRNVTQSINSHIYDIDVRVPIENKCISILNAKLLYSYLQYDRL